MAWYITERGSMRDFTLGVTRRTKGMRAEEVGTFSVLVALAVEGSNETEFGVMKKRLKMTGARLSKSLEALEKRNLVKRDGSKIQVID